MLISECWFALRLGIWICLLPIILRFRSLPELLKRNSLVQKRAGSRNPLEMERALSIVAWLCRLRIFRLPWFPRACLRQSLALYRVLTRMGYPVEIHFGIHKDREILQGHSWVTLQGRPIADGTRTEVFKLVYSYPRAQYKSELDETNWL